MQEADHDDVKQVQQEEDDRDEPAHDGEEQVGAARGHHRVGQGRTARLQHRRRRDPSRKLKYLFCIKLLIFGEINFKKNRKKLTISRRRSIPVTEMRYFGLKPNFCGCEAGVAAGCCTVVGCMFVKVGPLFWVLIFY
jgi:hypothetical protein